jgi:hydroxymethylbilane synthase
VTTPIRVGTRRSALARAQTALVLGRLRHADPSATFELVALDSAGDRERSPAAPLDFTGIFEEMLSRDRIDLAVHSAKDLPARTPSQFTIFAYPPRADVRDCLVARHVLRGGRLPLRARVGSSSLRRRAQLLRWRPDLEVVEVRGNVDTRIGLVRSRSVDAVALAVSGISRLGRQAEISYVLPAGRFLPAPGQGALALEGRREDRRVRRLAGTIDSPNARAAVTAERELAATLGGDCRLPLGALARVHERRLVLRAEVLSPDGTIGLAASGSDSLANAGHLGRQVGRSLRAAGARELLAQSPR